MNINKIKALFIHVGFLDKCKMILLFVFCGDCFCSFDFHKQTPSSRQIRSFIWYEWEWRTNRGHLLLQMLLCNDLTSFCHSVDEKWPSGSCRQDLAVLNREHGCVELQRSLKNSLITVGVGLELADKPLFSSKRCCFCFLLRSLNRVSYYLIRCSWILLNFIFRWLLCSVYFWSQAWIDYQLGFSFIGQSLFYWTFKWHPPHDTWYAVICISFSCHVLKELCEQNDLTLLPA